ncbi:MAG: Fumarate reductase iron-sulfur subunit [Deltaproteobacteria bacterium]|nr:Fumarate reductase iron-sulfur subunit [Deltaproteobacteria bacterium]
MGITVKIRRCSGHTDDNFRFDTFEVPLTDNSNVLDVVNYIQNNLDPTLAFRYSCRAGMCGTCSMRVNGKNRWTCRSTVKSLRSKMLTIEPLPHYPIIKDLAVDMRPFFDRYRHVRSEFVSKHPTSKEFAKIQPNSKERRDIDPQIECITCGCCYGECNLVETNSGYLGPAAINRAFTLIADSRDSAGEERLDLLNSPQGAWGCHTQFNCTDVCPMGISPTRAIQKLKRKEVGHAFKKFFS